MDEIIKQQEIVADSVKRYKTQLEEANKETARVTEANSVLKDNADSIQQNIDFLNGELEKRKQEVKDFEENHKIKSDELSVIEQTIEQKNLELAEMEKKSTEKINQEITDLQSEVISLSNNRTLLIIYKN